MAASDGLKIIFSAAFSGSALGTVKSINGESPVQWLKLRGQGKYGPSSIGLMRRDSNVHLTFFGGAPAAVDGTTKGSLVITLYKQDGSTTATWTWTNMKASNFSLSMDDDAPPAMIGQMFEVESDMATDNFTAS